MSASPPFLPSRASADDNFKGIVLMVVAMAAFALEDAFFKRAARELPIGQVLLLIGLGGAAIFAAVPRRGGAPLLHPAALSRTMRWRFVFELTGRLFYFLAVALTPLSSATAILQATPVLVVLGASLYFGERVGWVRWTAVAIGLAGVLVVLRPGAGDFSALSLLTVIGMIGFAGRDLASRAVPSSLGIRHLGFYGFLTVMLAGALYAVYDGRAFVWPSATLAWLLPAGLMAATGAYAALMKAMRTGEIAAVTPFRYTRLLFGIGIGVACFDEKVDAPMLLGCAVIVLAGLLIAWDGRRRSSARP